MSSGVIEILVFLGFVLPICWWQLRDLKQAKIETARKRAEAAKAKALLEAANSAKENGAETLDTENKTPVADKPVSP